MSEINDILNSFGKKVNQQSKLHLRSSPRRTRNKRINATKTLSNSLKHAVKAVPKGIELTFSMEDYGVDIDRGVMGSKRRILKFWNKSIFLPRGNGWKYAIKKGGGGQSQMFKSIEKWQSAKPVKGNTFAITRSIQLRGITPTLFFTDAFNKYEKMLHDDVLIGFGEDVEDKLND